MKGSLYLLQAAENAAIAALHVLKVCRVCDTTATSVSEHSMPPKAAPTGQLAGQPQQFFEQFRQGCSFPPPPQPLLPMGLYRM